MNHEELEEKLDGMVGAILLHNALYVRQSSGLVLVLAGAVASVGGGVLFGGGAGRK